MTKLKDPAGGRYKSQLRADLCQRSSKQAKQALMLLELEVDKFPDPCPRPPAVCASGELLKHGRRHVTKRTALVNKA